MGSWPRRELLHGRLGERAHRQRVHVQRQRPCRIRERLAVAQLELVRPQRDRQHAQAPGGRLEAHPGAGRGLVEDHPQPPASEPAAEGVRLALEPGGQVEQRAQAARPEVVEREEVPGRRMPASASRAVRSWPRLRSAMPVRRAAATIGAMSSASGGPRPAPARSAPGRPACPGSSRASGRWAWRTAPGPRRPR